MLRMNNGGDAKALWSACFKVHSKVAKICPGCLPLLHDSFTTQSKEYGTWEKRNTFYEFIQILFTSDNINRIHWAQKPASNSLSILFGSWPVLLLLKYIAKMETNYTRRAMKNDDKNIIRFGFIHKTRNILGLLRRTALGKTHDKRDLIKVWYRQGLC